MSKMQDTAKNIQWKFVNALLRGPDIEKLNRLRIKNRFLKFTNLKTYAKSGFIFFVTVLFHKF